MTYALGTIRSYISSAALAPKPTLQQRLVMFVKSSRRWTFDPILYGIGVIYSGMIPKNIGALTVSAAQITTLSLPLCIILQGSSESTQIGYLTSRDYSPPTHHNFVHNSTIACSVAIIVTSMIPTSYILSGTELDATWELYSPTLSTTALIILGWIYSAPRLWLKEIPVIDSILNGVIVWLSCFVGFTSARVLAGNLDWGLPIFQQRDMHHDW
ncbi:hypothetical protein B0J17DRAFT_633749 [Rhizoctonia solani]|nr:hypothetical protein B0J17DRAFT_633749 [Rhizoctonia solani]